MRAGLPVTLLACQGRQSLSASSVAPAQLHNKPSDSTKSTNGGETRQARVERRQECGYCGYTIPISPLC